MLKVHTDSLRKHCRNSLSLQMLKELQEAVGEEDPSLRCITLEAQGKVFSAGHNLKELVSFIYVAYFSHQYIENILKYIQNCMNH